MKIRIYNNSVLASALSIFGSLYDIIGIFGIINGQYLIGIFMLVFGIAHGFLASYISERKQVKSIIAELHSKGLDELMKQSEEACAEFYNKYPQDVTLKCISVLNPKAAEAIKTELSRMREEKRQERKNRKNKK